MPPRPTRCQDEEPFWLLSAQNKFFTGSVLQKLSLRYMRTLWWARDVRVSSEISAEKRFDAARKGYLVVTGF